jgi:hypothetical protein
MSNVDIIVALATLANVFLHLNIKNAIAQLELRIGRNYVLKREVHMYCRGAKIARATENEDEYAQ